MENLLYKAIKIAYAIPPFIESVMSRFIIVLSLLILGGLSFNYFFLSNELSDYGALAPSAGTSSSVGYTAHGNEPFWSIRMDASGIILSTAKDKHMRFTHNSPDIEDESAIYRAQADSKSLAVEMTSKPCKDSMSGVWYPDQVQVTLESEQFSGCGGDPAKLLQGAQWSIVSLAEEVPAEGTRPAMQFMHDKKLAGNLGCNRFSAGYQLSGEKLTILPAAYTRMNCTPEAMAFERRFFELLGQVTSFNFDGSGALVLTTSDGLSIIARRLGVISN